MKNKLTLMFMAIGFAATPMFALAEPGIQTGWFFTQLSGLILIVAGGLTVMFFIQKQTVKAITTLLCGSIFYIIVKSPESTFTALGNFIKGLLGIA